MREPCSTCVYKRRKEEPCVDCKFKVMKFPYDGILSNNDHWKDGNILRRLFEVIREIIWRLTWKYRNPVHDLK